MNQLRTACSLLAACLLASGNFMLVAAFTGGGRMLADDSILTQIGFDIPPPFQDRYMCGMDINADASCVVQSYCLIDSGFYSGHAIVYCRNDNAASPIDGTGGSWEVKGGQNDMIISGATDMNYWAVAINGNGDRVAAGNWAGQWVDVYDYSGGIWSRTDRLTVAGGRFGNTLDLDATGSKLVVGDYQSNSYYAYEFVVNSGWTQVHTSSVTAPRYAETVAIKEDGSAFAVVKRDVPLQVDLIEWDTWTTASFSASYQPSSGDTRDISFSEDGTKIVLAVDDFNSGGDDAVEVHEISGATYVGLFSNSVINLGSGADLTRGMTALNRDGTLLAIGEPDIPSGPGTIWLYKYNEDTQTYNNIATKVGATGERIGFGVELSPDGTTMIATTALRDLQGGLVKGFEVDLGTASPTASPTEEAFVVYYAGSAKAGFGEQFQGNEVSLPFVISPVFAPETSLFYDDCTTPMPDGIMIASSSTEDAGINGNLLKYDVGLTLNIPVLGDLKNATEDSPLWKGDDGTSKELTFCVRVDLMSDIDLVAGDEVSGQPNKTSVNFEAVLVEVGIDFTSEIANITGVSAAAQAAQAETVAAEVYGLTGCHCDGDNSCYDDVNNVAPALTLDDTLDVCFDVSAAAVSIVDVTVFIIAQGGLSFDSISAGTAFYTESFDGSKATFRSRLPAAFFENVTLTLSAQATVELSFSRRLRGSYSSSSTTGGSSLELGGRRLQDSRTNAEVSIEVSGVAVSDGESAVEILDEGKAAGGDEEFVGSGTVIILVVCVALLVVGLILISLFVVRRRRGLPRQSAGVAPTKGGTLE